jgi:hypothetical protein
MKDRKVTLTQDQRIAIMRGVHQDFIANGKTVARNPLLDEFCKELKERHATEDLVVEHGLLGAKAEDVEDEAEFLTTDKIVDFDSDENEVDMETISPTMREVSQSKKER